MKRPVRLVAMLLAASLTVGELITGGLGITALAGEYDAVKVSYSDELPDVLSASYTYSNGTLTLKGNVNSTEIQNYTKKNQVKKIVAAKGTVLPENCVGLFAYYTECEEIDLSNADTSKVTDMTRMFYECYELKTLDVSSFDTKNVTSMQAMFYFCRSLKELKLSNFDTSNVTNMNLMFCCMHSCPALDLSNFNTAKVKDMSYMFAYSENLKSLDLSGKGFNTENVTWFGSMFGNLANLETIKLGKNFEYVIEEMALDNSGGLGWSREDGTESVSGRGDSAIFFNNGVNTYHKRKELQGNLTIEGVGKYDAVLRAKVTDCNVDDLQYQWFSDDESLFAEDETTFHVRSMYVGHYISCEVKSKRPWIVGTLKAKMKEKIDKMDGPGKLNGLEGVAPTKKGGSDGKITGAHGVVEYATKADFSDKKTCDCTYQSITGLKAGTYYVRIAEGVVTYPGEATKVIVPDGKAALSGKVAITGALKYGQTLTAKISDSNASKFTYQWKRGSSAIKGATTSTYKLVKADIGQTISCVVSDADDKVTGTLSAKTASKITKADSPAEPADLKGVAPSEKGKADGKITGVKTTMEYATKSDFSNAKACTSKSITGLKAGTYYVRVKETETTFAGKAATVKVPQGKTAVQMDVTKVFKDVEANQWYVEAIQFVYDNGIMNGTSDTTFSPLMVLTRGQFVTVLYNMEGRPNTSFASNTFKDVKEKEFYALPVVWAAKNEITSGIGENQFAPNQNITREQLAVMLYKYAKVKKYKTTFNTKALDNYSDKGAVNNWAVEALQWAVSNKVIGGKAGKNGNILDPSGQATRAECAQMIKNLRDNVAK